MLVRISYTENKMDFPPNIPTSFVPHTTHAAPRRYHANLSNAFDIFAYFILGIVFVLAIGVFLYGMELSSSKKSKDAELASAESTINQTTVENFVRLRDRLASGETLLENHIAFSGFFTVLGTLVPTTVRFSSIHLLLNDKDGTVDLEGSGVAKSFNALAVASSAFAKDGRIKNAIFSNIAINPKDNSVSFALAATLDPKLVAFSP